MLKIPLHTDQPLGVVLCVAVIMLLMPCYVMNATESGRQYVPPSKALLSVLSNPAKSKHPSSSFLEQRSQSDSDMTTVCVSLSSCLLLSPHAGSGVVRIDPLRHLAGCRKRRLNHALSALSLRVVSHWAAPVCAKLRTRVAN